MAAEITLDNLKRHIEKYGPDGVMETARDYGFSVAALCELQVTIDRLPTKRFKVKHRKTVEQRVRSWLGLPEEENETT